MLKRIHSFNVENTQIQFCVDGRFIICAAINIGGITVGYSFCSQEDTFDQIKGMAVALSRTLDNGKVPQGLRNVVWDAFQKSLNRTTTKE